VRRRFKMDPESCPMLYTCSKVKMTPMIRVLLRCTAAEAMQSICANCDEIQETGRNSIRADAKNEKEKDYTYISPSGQKIMVVVGDMNRHEDTCQKGNASR
jgi:hypothetical protein